MAVVSNHLFPAVRWQSCHQSSSVDPFDDSAVINRSLRRHLMSSESSIAFPEDIWWLLKSCNYVKFILFVIKTRPDRSTDDSANGVDAFHRSVFVINRLHKRHLMTGKSSIDLLEAIWWQSRHQSGSVKPFDDKRIINRPPEIHLMTPRQRDGPFVSITIARRLWC